MNKMFKSRKKNTKAVGGIDTLNEIKIATYKEQFEIQYFNYTSASILFTE